MKNLVFFILLFSPALASSQNLISNYQIGALVCNDKVTLLDYVEGALFKGIIYSEDLPLAAVLENIRLVMGERADLYQQSIGLFTKKSQLITTQSEQPMPNEDLIVKAPQGCHYSVLVDSNLIDQVSINAGLWNRLTPMEQLGAALNWSVAKESFVLNGMLPQRSIYIRNLNSLLTSEVLAKTSAKDLIEMLKKAGLSTLRKQGILIDLNKNFVLQGDLFKSAFPVQNSIWFFSQNGKVQPLVLKKDAVLFHGDGKVRLIRFEGHLVWSTQGNDIPFSTPDGFSKVELDRATLNFFPNGMVERGYVTQVTKFKNDRIDCVLGQYHYVSELMNNSLLSFFPDGSLDTISKVSGKMKFESSWIRLVSNSSVVWQEDGRLKEFTTPDTVNIVIQGKKSFWSGYIDFHFEGNLQCGFSAANVKFKDLNGKEKTFPNGSQICFDDQENVN